MSDHGDDKGIFSLALVLMILVCTPESLKSSRCMVSGRGCYQQWCDSPQRDVDEDQGW